VPATLEVRSNKFSDVYDTSFQFGAELGYGLSESVELFAGLNYSKSEGSTANVGVTTVAALNASYDTFGTFGDLENFGLDVGARYFFAGDRFRPFVGGSLGVVQQEALDATFTVPDAPSGGITISDVNMFKDTTSLAVGLEGGMAMSLGERIDGRVSVGAKYIDGLKGEDTDLDSLGLA
jgi:Outer membrane protein beta-barrel domain